MDSSGWQSLHSGEWCDGEIWEKRGKAINISIGMVLSGSISRVFERLDIIKKRRERMPAGKIKQGGIV